MIRQTQIPKSLDCERLDHALHTLFPDLSRAAIVRCIEAKLVQLDGVTARKPSVRVKVGAKIALEEQPPLPSTAEPDSSVQLDVVFEDRHLIVVNKAAGVVVHPAKGHVTGTLVNGLLARGTFEAFDQSVSTPKDSKGELADEWQIRPGIVHRIDKDTSGLLVIAKSVRAREGLLPQFAVHSVERVYDALAVGALDNAVRIETLIGRDPRNRKAFTTKVAEGKRAVTNVQVLERLVLLPRAGKMTVTHIECRLETGRTHQIRVHLADFGAPLLGDPLYGKSLSEPLREIAHKLGRQALHARTLGFVHPITRKKMSFSVPWPDDFSEALEAIRAAIRRT